VIASSSEHFRSRPANPCTARSTIGHVRGFADVNDGAVDAAAPTTTALVGDGSADTAVAPTSACGVVDPVSLAGDGGNPATDVVPRSAEVSSGTLLGRSFAGIGGNTDPDVASGSGTSVSPTSLGRSPALDKGASMIVIVANVATAALNTTPPTQARNGMPA
jgi:hypothetical protein